MRPGDELIALKAFSHLSGVKAVTPAFVCHDPEGDWINDMRDQAPTPDAAQTAGEDTTPDKETETSAPCSPSSQS